MPKGEPRKHHYLPQFYLAGFTPSDQHDDHVHVLDTRSLRQWRPAVRKVAHKRDLYRLEGNDDPGVVEKALAQIEADVSPAVKRLVETKTFTYDEDGAKVLRFVALMESRVPQVMDQSHEFIDKVGKAMLREYVATPERWESLCMQFEAAGGKLGSVSYQQMKDFAERGHYSIRLDQNTVVSLMMDSADVVLRLLFRRSWTVGVAEAGTCFVCSDRPVTLFWTTTHRPPWAISPGFGLPWAAVVMPISKDVAIFGTMGLGRGGTFHLGLRDVAIFNRYIGGHGCYIYSPQADFPWLTSDGRIGNTADLLEALRKGRESQ